MCDPLTSIGRSRPHLLMSIKLINVANRVIRTHDADVVAVLLLETCQMRCELPKLFDHRQKCVAEGLSLVDPVGSSLTESQPKNWEVTSR